MDKDTRPDVILEDDDKEPVYELISHRIPWLIVGLIGGIVATIISSVFETLISKNIQLVFFIPVIVYMADAVGTQTETIYIRNLARGRISHSSYLVKEFLTGIALGILFGIALGLFAFLWFHSMATAITVALAMAINTAVAPVMAMAIPGLLQKERTDPALGSGPFTTVLQDLTSLLVYFLIASVIIFGNFF